MFLLRPPRPALLERLLIEESTAPFSYAEVGATAGALPAGYRHDRLSTVIGSGRSTFERAARHLDRWGLQRSVGFVVFPDVTKVAEGQTVLLTVRVGPVFSVASTRVVYTVEEESRSGFAYGTLPEHPEIGEEYFGVTIDDDGAVRFETVAFSRPGARLARLGGPVTRRAQLSTMRQYLRAMEKVGDG